MNKITKKQGQLKLMENISKLVLIGNVKLDRAEEFLNMENKKYKELTKNIAYRKGIKYNNNEVVFEILEGDKQGNKSWLNSLIGTKWYEHYSNNGKFIVIDFGDDDFCKCMAYELED